MLADVRFQDEAVSFLRGMVEGRVTNPLLLVGQEGTGRRFAAIQSAKEIFCSGTRDASCPCADCLQVTRGFHPDLQVLAPIDGKDIGVEAARQVLDASLSYPSQGRYRVFVLDGADRLTVPAANALLKTLEEPPHTSRFILLAESAQRVLPTIRSRCGLLNFRPLPEPFVLESVSRFEADPAKALVLTRLGEGSVGRTIQYWGSGRLALRDKALSLLVSAQSRDVAGVFLAVDQLEKDLPLTLRFMHTLVHDLIVLGVAPDRLVNSDRADNLRALKPPANGWHALHRELCSVLETSQHAKIQLAFHVKALLLQSFMGA